ncbi:MAG: hypothetical protein ABI806_17710 [Candidatus Solibacter sp.]
MKTLLEVCVIGSIMISAVSAQDSPAPMLRKGVSVQMATAGHAVEMRAADQPDATVVAITAEGKVYSGIEPTQAAALSNLKAGTVYVKADSRVPFQTVLAVLDALRGKSVVLLTTSPAAAEKTKPLSPYGIKVAVSR